MSEQFDTFMAAYGAATNPGTRTPVNVQTKNNLRKSMTATVRRLVKVVQAWPEMTDTKRRLLGISVPDVDPSPVPVPGGVPLLEVVSVQGRILNVVLREEGSTGRAKPAKVRCAYLYTYVGEAEPTSFGVFTFYAEATRTNPQVVMPESVLPGTKVWLSACWVNGKGEAGSACMPVATWTNHTAMQRVA